MVHARHESISAGYLACFFLIKKREKSQKAGRKRTVSKLDHSWGYSNPGTNLGGLSQLESVLTFR